MVSCYQMQQLKDIANSRNLLWNLTLRELRSKYRRSVLGWSWSMLNPLAQMAIYTFVFGVLFGAKAPVGNPSGITTYGLYLLTGLIPWGFFSLVCGVGLQSILSNTTLVRKVAFARESLVISQVLFCSVQFLIEMSLVCVALMIAGSFILPWLPITERAIVKPIGSLIATTIRWATSVDGETYGAPVTTFDEVAPTA